MRVLRGIERRAAGGADALPATLHPRIRRIYAARGIRSREELDLGLRGLAPVGTLGGIDAAVELLLRHRDGRVLIVGDFDADGATSTALVIRCLRAFGFADVHYLVPNRFEFGYGLSRPLAEVALQSRPTLIVTVDNGISSVGGVACAREAGVDVLVTDHHLPPARLPEASVILNPNLAGDAFASKHLAGVGVAFYLMAALGRRLESGGAPGSARVPATYLDLVAVGTVADVVALDRNNRILVEQGLRRIRAGQAVPGVLAIIAESGRDFRRIVSGDLGFAVGPRLNAAGRLEDMSIGIEALLTDSPIEARSLAARLGEINATRREIEADMQSDALQALADRHAAAGGALPACLALYDRGWHQGIVGLIAGRIRERANRPVFAFAAAADALLKGSGRSIPGVHLRDLLAWVDAREPGLITRFGGHAMAAGLTLPRAHLEAFAAEVAGACERLFPDADFAGCWLSDGPLEPDEFALGFAEALRDAGPWGQAFPEPLFDGEFRLHDARVVGQTHLKMRVSPGDSDVVVDAIAFGQGELAPVPRGAVVELVYRLDVNEYRGIRAPQLIVEQTRII